MLGFISGLSILFHGSICLSLHHLVVSWFYKDPSILRAFKIPDFRGCHSFPIFLFVCCMIFYLIHISAKMSFEHLKYHFLAVLPKIAPHSCSITLYYLSCFIFFHSLSHNLKLFIVYTFNMSSPLECKFHKGKDILSVWEGAWHFVGNQ